MRGLTPRQVEFLLAWVRNRRDYAISAVRTLTETDGTASEVSYRAGRADAFDLVRVQLEELTATAGRRKRTSRDRPPGG